MPGAGRSWHRGRGAAAGSGAAAAAAAGEAGGVVLGVVIGERGSEEEVETEEAESMMCFCQNEVAVKQSGVLILTLVDEAMRERRQGGKRKSGL